tara:strand:- start:415 stop:663 length:249 start_codon:yes stop_codon:yes gene_type:complete
MEEVVMNVRLLARCVFSPSLRMGGARIVALVRSICRTLTRWQRLAYERCLLASLSDGQLHDIGISRAEALNEAGRPFWDDKA